MKTLFTVLVASLLTMLTGCQGRTTEKGVKEVPVQKNGQQQAPAGQPAGAPPADQPKANGEPRSIDVPPVVGEPQGQK